MALLDTPVCDFGWQAPPFELKDASGGAHTFASVMGERGLLLAFICNHCPYVQAIIERLVADANTLMSEGVGVAAIMSNDYKDYPADAPPQMKHFAQAHDFSFPYLVDETQAVAKAYGAVCTPDFFGLNKDGALHYRGRLDDAKMGSEQNRTPELLNAMRQIAKDGKGPQQQTPSIGCSIKWNSQ